MKTKALPSRLGTICTRACNTASNTLTRGPLTTNQLTWTGLCKYINRSQSLPSTEQRLEYNYYSSSSSPSSAPRLVLLNQRGWHCLIGNNV